MPWVETIDLEVGKSLESDSISEEEMDWNKESTDGNIKLYGLEERFCISKGLIERGKISKE